MTTYGPLNQSLIYIYNIFRDQTNLEWEHEMAMQTFSCTLQLAGIRHSCCYTISLQSFFTLPQDYDFCCIMSNRRRLSQFIILKNPDELIYLSDAASMNPTRYFCC